MDREFDTPWKEALTTFLQFLLELLAKDLADAIDWSRGFTDLETELNQILREGEQKGAVADKLFRVVLKTGMEMWILIHIEVQAQRDEDFERRMFVYYYRIADRYNIPVVSLAILADNSPAWRPSVYRYESFGCELAFRFRTVKLVDFEARVSELEASDNPAALILLAHLRSHSTHGVPLERTNWKFRLIRTLLERYDSAELIRKLFRVIDWLLELPAELESQLKTKIHEFEKERAMPYVTTYERLVLEEGRQQGLHEGRSEGQILGMREMIEWALESKFGAIDSQTKAFLEQIANINDLRKLKSKLATLDRLDQLPQILAET